MKPIFAVSALAITFTFAASAFCLLFPVAAYSWDAQGMIYGTDIEYSMLEISKKGVKVRFTNTYDADVKTSFKLIFYDKTGNTVGYSVFGLREIPGNTYVDIGNNYLNGSLKACRSAARIAWQKMTYEPVY